MKVLKTLLVVVMALSFAVQPAFIDVLFAAEPKGTSTYNAKTLAASAAQYTNVQQSSAWLNALNTMTAEAAAAQINAYVKDDVTALNVAVAVSKLEPAVAALILNRPRINIALIAQGLSKMQPARAAKFMDGMSSLVAAKILSNIDPIKAGGIVLYMDNAKAAVVMAKLPADKAGKILFAQDPNKHQPVVNNVKILYILERMSPDSAAKIIDTYCVANSKVLPSRVEEIFRKEVPSVSAKIFTSSSMSVTTAARIISAVGKGFPDKAKSILDAISAINKRKAAEILKVMGGVPEPIYREEIS